MAPLCFNPQQDLTRLWTQQTHSFINLRPLYCPCVLLRGGKWFPSGFFFLPSREGSWVQPVPAVTPRAVMCRIWRGRRTQLQTQTLDLSNKYNKKGIIKRKLTYFKQKVQQWTGGNKTKQQWHHRRRTWDQRIWQMLWNFKETKYCKESDWWISAADDKWTQVRQRS